MRGHISSSSTIPGEQFLRQRSVKIPRTSYYAVPGFTVPAYTLDDVSQHFSIIAFEVLLGRYMYAAATKPLRPPPSPPPSLRPPLRPPSPPPPSVDFHSARNQTSFHFFLGIARIDSDPFIPRPESELHRTNAVECIEQTLRNQNPAE